MYTCVRSFLPFLTKESALKLVNNNMLKCWGGKLMFLKSSILKLTIYPDVHGVTDEEIILQSINHLQFFLVL